ncbi:isocitrate/isopropylmalate family dehydrogenase, partial [Escherichia coli]|uniref:isocitrate/isopropylmalate family dehydrogenase n=1 Tax=Escherichia coli TaxID=562 RepID=UPI0035E42BBD
MTQALKVLDAVRNRFAMRITTRHYDVGGEAIDNHRPPLPPSTGAGCEDGEAALVGVVGGRTGGHLAADTVPGRGGPPPLGEKLQSYGKRRWGERMKGGGG